MSKRFALIIGNSEYKDPRLAQLITPSADVKRLTRLLRTPDIGGFDDVGPLINMTSARVRRAIARLFAGKKPDDLLLLFFSGHGVRDDRGDLYLAVKDTERHLLSATAIPATFITGEMDRSHSRRQVLILDCCHSGAFARGTKGVLGGCAGTAAAFEGTGYGRVVLTASDSTQYAWEGDQIIGEAENSVFTHYLIQGIQTGEADSDADGLIGLDELYDYVYEHVVNKTPKQTPGKWAYKQHGEIVIAKNPRPIVKPAELPPELRQAIESPLPSVREAAVRDLDRLLRGSHKGLSAAAEEALAILAMDDSRRVSIAATDYLAAYAEARRGVSQVTVERRKGKIRGQPRPPGELDRRPPEQLPTDVKPVGEEAAEPSVAWVPAAPLEMNKIWSSILLITAGFGIVFAIFAELRRSIGDSLIVSDGFLAWGLCGLIIALTVRRIEPSITLKQMLMITGGWTVPFFLLGLAPLSALAFGFARAVSGFITGLVLKQVEPSLKWSDVYLVSAGWTMVFIIDAFSGFRLGTLVYGYLRTAMLPVLPDAVWAAFTGAIGSGIMFWQFSRARRHS